MLWPKKGIFCKYLEIMPKFQANLALSYLSIVFRLCLQVRDLFQVHKCNPAHVIGHRIISMYGVTCSLHPQYTHALHYNKFLNWFYLACYMFLAMMKWVALWNHVEFFAKFYEKLKFNLFISYFRMLFTKFTGLNSMDIDYNIVKNNLSFGSYDYVNWFFFYRHSSTCKAFMVSDRMN